MFISHAHIDHIGGFLWLPRVRIQAGPENHEDLPEVHLTDGLLVDDPLFSVRTVTLDRGTPVRAYAFESKVKLNVDQETLKAHGLSAGARLVTVTPGEKLVHATDLADTEANLNALANLARNADILFCESCFLAADSEQARRIGHLTTRACGRIATAADVRQLVPFHFSRRYETNPEAVYLELTLPARASSCRQRTACGTAAKRFNHDVGKKVAPARTRKFRYFSS